MKKELGCVELLERGEKKCGHSNKKIEKSTEKKRPWMMGEKEYCRAREKFQRRIDRFVLPTSYCSVSSSETC